MSLVTSMWAKPLRLREKFTDAELDELLKLAGRRRTALAAAEAALVAAVDPRMALIDDYAGKINRYAVIKATMTAPGDKTGKALASAVADILDVKGHPGYLKTSRISGGHGWSVRRVVGDSGRKERPRRSRSPEPKPGWMDVTKVRVSLQEQPG